MELVSGSDHRRDATSMTYVYAVVSRRAGGISIGVNLNPNNACNWRCIYCQVPGLTRGAPPAIDLHQLDSELRSMLESIGARSAASQSSHVEDVAFSGNGESTLSPMFAPAVVVVRNVLRDMQMSGKRQTAPYYEWQPRASSGSSGRIAGYRRGGGGGLVQGRWWVAGGDLSN